jgi:hypothetical protein
MGVAQIQIAFLLTGLVLTVMVQFWALGYLYTFNLISRARRQIRGASLKQQRSLALGYHGGISILGEAHYTRQ